MNPSQAEFASRSPLAPAIILGVGLSGFFDGILLHQVLQWHHLLSLVPGEAFRDVGTQILADGLFHVLMYVITGWGLWLLWRRRSALEGADGTWRTIAGGGLLGFGAWNVLDVVFFHWILGIHRIRVDVDHPMAYDLAWLAAFGLVPLAFGMSLVRRGSAGNPGRGPTTAIMLALITVLAGAVGARPGAAGDAALVFVAPGTSAAVINAAMAADARLLWVDPHGRMIVVSTLGQQANYELYRSGALYVTRSPVIAGCVRASGWS